MFGRDVSALLALTYFICLSGSSGWGCGNSDVDCYGFKKSAVTLSIVAEFDEETVYQNDAHPWPHGRMEADGMSASCGTAELASAPIRIEETGRWSDGISCPWHYGSFTEGVDFDIPNKEAEDEHNFEILLNSAIGRADLQAAGRGELFEGCSGWYTLLLYSGPQYYAGAIVPEDQILDPPTPGLPPNWLVLRMFEPDGECEGLDLGDDPLITWCADTWVAQIDSIDPR